MKSMLASVVTASLFVLGAASCGGSGDDSGTGDDTPAVDAGIDGQTFDAMPSSVMEVDCASSAPVLTVTAPGFSYTFTPNDTNISVDDVVEFDMPGSHNAVSNTANLFKVNFSQDKCLKFTAAGSFTFHCQPHGFTGTITVQ